MIARRGRTSERGNAMVEFALASVVLIPVMTGAFQFGYSFYTYNLLQSAVSNGGRYAAFRTYRCLNGATDVTKVKQAIQNMCVYGTPSPSGADKPVVAGLAPSNIDVTFTLSSTQVPTAVSVSVNRFTVKAIFKNYTLTGKPKLSLPYLGRYAPEESEP